MTTIIPNGSPNPALYSTIETADGTLYVSKPFLSSGSKRLRALIAFTPRTSHFDTNNAQSGVNEFRGFFTLFWISIFLLTVQSYIHSYEATGQPIALAFAAMFSRHAGMLALSDGVLVLSTSFCVFFARLLQKRWISYYGAGLAIQHTFQALVLATAVTWTFHRQWPWVQSGYLTLHSFVMIMKSHSYMAVNGYLSWIDEQYRETEALLRAACESSAIGGWDKALSDAKAAQPPSPSGSQLSTQSGSGTPSVQGVVVDGTTKSYIDAPTAVALRNRLLAHVSNDQQEKANTSPPPPSSFDILTHHPSSHISSMAKDLTAMEKELISKGPERVQWPQNVTIKNFAEYQLFPTLVYELEFPRTDKIRPLYVLEKTVATFGSFALLYTVTAHLILPLVPTSNQSFLRSLLDLALPFMLSYLLLFYIIFECICNGFAELSRFADRGFYEDWVCHSELDIHKWNATSWDEFARKWNKPVHNFLLLHVYASTISHYKLSKHSATLVTFLLSAIAHELVMVVVTKKIRMYLFLLQMIQMPMIALGRIPAIRRNRTLGNIVFWLGLYAGFPLLCVAYCAY
ncbi:MBOAT-domain-containing protein [Sistotremastrum niveocremeum HHB9708]|uniref:O-acyltransferase n=1 Tax=Sistotremastrum niveocremeum HHB9708 TaxID=1314777 RepID=A0A164VS07_9AGAM|nr:MBOAT-domain-containing protein [Sistotremastrum niveocremeum HHB9708]